MVHKLVPVQKGREKHGFQGKRLPNGKSGPVQHFGENAVKKIPYKIGQEKGAAFSQQIPSDPLLSLRSVKIPRHKQKNKYMKGIIGEQPPDIEQIIPQMPGGHQNDPDRRQDSHLSVFSYL